MQNVGHRVLSSELFWTGLALIVMLGASAAISLGLLAIPAPLVVAGCLAALGCALILWQPYLGILLFLGMMYLRVEQFFPMVAKMRLPLLLSSLTLMAWGVQVLLKRETFRWHPELGWVGGFALAMVLSSFRVPGVTQTMDTLQDAAKLFLLFLLLQQLLNTERRTYRALQWLLVFTVGLAACGIAGWVSGSSALLENGRMRAKVASGLFDDPNDLAAALVVAVPVALLLALRARHLLVRVWGGVALAALLVGIYLCNSRGGMLALGVALGVFMVFQLGWVRGSLLGAAAVVLLFAFGPDRFSPETLSGDDSAMGRIMAWEAGLGMMLRSPLLGMGYDQFREHHVITAHNSFILAVGEGGLLTATCWVGMNYWALLSLARLRRAAQQDPAGGLWAGYVAAVQAGLLASLAAGMFLSHTFRPIPVIPVAIAAALGGLNLGGEKDRRPSDLPHVLAVPAVTAGLVLLFYLVARISL